MQRESQGSALVLYQFGWICVACVTYTNGSLLQGWKTLSYHSKPDSRTRIHIRNVVQWPLIPGIRPGENPWKSCFPFWIRPLSLPYPWPRIRQGYSTHQMRVKPGSRIFTHQDLQRSSQVPNSLQKLVNNNIKMNAILYPINQLQVDTRSATFIVQAWWILPSKPRIKQQITCGDVTAYSWGE